MILTYNFPFLKCLCLFVVSLSGFGISVLLASPPLQFFFQISLKKRSLILLYLVKFTCEAIWISILLFYLFFCLFFFLITGQIFSSYWSVQILFLLFLPDSILEDCMFLGVYPPLPGCPIYWHIIIHNNSLYSCGVNYYFLFISDFIYLVLFSFLMSVTNGLTVLFTFSQNQLLVSLTFSIIIFFQTFYFCSDPISFLY